MPESTTDASTSAEVNPWQVSPARMLGYGGAAVIPSLLLMAWAAPELAPFLLRSSVVYGASIFAFLGGIQWGLAINHASSQVGLRRLIVSVVPSLWAVASMSVPTAGACVLLIMGFACLLAYEWRERSDDIYPKWYLPLRTKLTACMVAGLFLVLMYPRPG